MLRQKEKDGEQAGAFLPKPRHHASDAKLSWQAPKKLEDKRTADKESAANSRARKKGRPLTWVTTASHAVPNSGAPLPFPERAALGKARRGEERRTDVCDAIETSHYTAALQMPEQSDETSSLSGRRPKWKLLASGRSTELGSVSMAC